jgi:integrase
MPLKITKRNGSPYWQITGSLCGERVRESTGTADKREAELRRLELEKAILSKRKRVSDYTLADAILAYIENGGETKFLAPINEHMGRYLLSDLNQEVLDRNAREIFSTFQHGKKLKAYKKSTIVRQFYTPLASVLHYAADMGWIPYSRIRKPKAERPAPQWANEKWFAKFFEHAHPDIAAVVTFLAGTGCRISEVLLADWRDTNLAEGWTYVRTTKNGEPRLVYLPPFVVDALRPYETDAGRIFSMYASRFSVNQAIERVCKRAGIEYLSSHKVGSHTYATNLSIYAGMDAKALTATGRWKDPKSTHFYTHFVTREMARKADTLAQILTQRPSK